MFKYQSVQALAMHLNVHPSLREAYMYSPFVACGFFEKRLY